MPAENDTYGAATNDIRNFAEEVINNVEKVIVGKRPVIELVLIALLCEGHVLIEDAPGTGKTMLARAVAITTGLEFKRVQCTPDLLPNDVTGVSIFNQKTRQFEFRPGPVFTNLLLADEINRATPRTQSALLEAMGGRGYLPACQTIPAAGNPEPDRVRRHLSSARGSNGPLPTEDQPRLPRPAQ
jgi:MoxR-like ATPase